MKSMLKVAIIFLVIAFNLNAQKSAVIRVVVKDKQTIRDIAKEYLEDPNLWEEILRSNKINNPTDVKSGMTLTIPYNQIMRAKKAVDEALIEIQKATNAGAKSFATDLINKAVNLHSQSLKERKSGNWDRSFQLAQEAKQNAINAAQEASIKSASKGEASLSFAKGKVEAKAGVENLWKSIPLFARLIENDRVRTLSESYAEVSFQDKSKIRLSENSTALIQRNRVDLLNNRSEAKVTLEKGGAFALLAGAQGKRKFNLEAPGLEANVKSKAYWMNKDDKTTKVANYDGEIELKSKNSKVTLKTNQGTSLLTTGSLTQPKDLLKTAQLISPDNEKIIYSSKTKLAWSKVQGAEHYWLMLSSDASFKTIVTQTKDINTNEYLVDMERGSYYWRISAIDKEGFPGPFTEPKLFTLIVNNDPPYLSISNPSTDKFVTEKSILIKGNTESLSKVIVNGDEVVIDSNGYFEKQIVLSEGKNEIIVTSTDLTGNKATVRRLVQFSVGEKPFIKYDDSVIPINKKVYTTTNTLTIRGRSTANSTIMAQTKPVASKVLVVADSTGKFQFTISRLSDSTCVIIESKNKEQKSIIDTLDIILDKDLPKIEFYDELPEKTSDNMMTVTGHVSAVTSLRLNGSVLEVKQNKFVNLYELKAGLNELVFIAVNRNGAKTKVTRNVFLDLTPPELIKYTVSPKKILKNALVSFEIIAKDKVDLKKTAKVIYQIGDEIYTEYLNLDESTSIYRKIVNCYSSVSEDIKVKMIILEDQLGNIKEYNISTSELQK